MSEPNANSSGVQEFIIIGFPGLSDQKSRRVLFAVFLTVYLFILLGNCSFLAIFASTRHLHNPMYFLISGLAVLDIIITTNTVPSMLVVFIFNSRTTPFASCFIQIFVFLGLMSSESFLLCLMAYDRYIAICNPLLYPTLMDNSRALKMMACCCMGGFIIPGAAVIVTLQLPFCGPNIVVQCFCDYSSVLMLACGDNHIISFVILAIGLAVLFVPLVYILFTYFCVIRHVLQMTSQEGRLKVFYTCGTHMMVIFVYFFIAAGVFISYRIPDTSVDMRIMAAVIQNVFPALVNPIIYCLRTKEIRESFVKTLRKFRIVPVTS
ncbi:OR5V1 protein, partial [Polypterus senegalus]|nr:OR5V1 protein [Polypterus senegalus]